MCNPHDTQWEMYSYPKAASSGLCWKPCAGRRSGYLHQPDLKIKDFIQPWKLEPFSKGLGLASVLMWQVGWSLVLCVCLQSQGGCVIARFSPLSLPIPVLTMWRSRDQHLLLISPAIRTVLLQCHHPFTEGHFPALPRTKRHSCASPVICALSQVFTC